MRLALIGMPGSGKSTVGRRLARQLGLEFRDSDQIIEQRLGRSVREYFEQCGEAAFRALEEEVIDEQSVASIPMVLATGGGAVLRETNRRHLRDRMNVIYLRSTPEDLMRRLRHDQTRPLLQVSDPLRRLQELFAVRDPLYRETAHWVVDTGQPSVASLVTMIVKKIGLHCDPNHAGTDCLQGSNQSKTGVSSA